MKLLYSIVILCLLAPGNDILVKAEIRFFDLLNSGSSIGAGLVMGVVDVIPKPGNLIKDSKDLLFGLAETATFKTINKLCSLYLAAKTINPRITPNMESMAFILRTPCNEIRFPLTHAEEILESTDFDVNKKVVITVTGWMSGPEADYVTDMANAFNCRGDYNFLVLDSSDSIETLYSWSAYNTEEVGHQLAVFLQKLVKLIPAKNIHLIGHSLGAHIVGYAGRYFTKYTGFYIARITGLDPANPCFNEGETLSGLQRGDAEFIDIIHSNPGALGKEYPLGDVDFYPAGLAPIKPGCLKFPCSHSRAYEYFVESVYPGNENNFLGIRCNSLKRLNNGFCDGTKYPMGLAVPRFIKGNYFLNVNAEKPYGQYHNHQSTVPRECGKCKVAAS